MCLSESEWKIVDQRGTNREWREGASDGVLPAEALSPALSDTPSLPPRTQTLLCLFPGAKLVQTEGSGEGGIAERRGIFGWRDGGMEGQKKEMAETQTDEEKLFLPDRMQASLERGGGSL